MTRFMKHKLPSGGFTLIELLVVVAIIAMLAALLLPTLNKAKATGKTAVCISNLRQWAVMNTLYADDFGGLLPPGLDRYNPLGPMQGSFWRYIHRAGYYNRG